MPWIEWVQCTTRERRLLYAATFWKEVLPTRYFKVERRGELVAGSPAVVLRKGPDVGGAGAALLSEDEERHGDEEDVFDGARASASAGADASNSEEEVLAGDEDVDSCAGERASKNTRRRERQGKAVADEERSEDVVELPDQQRLVISGGSRKLSVRAMRRLMKRLEEESAEDEGEEFLGNVKEEQEVLVPPDHVAVDEDAGGAAAASQVATSPFDVATGTPEYSLSDIVDLVNQQKTGQLARLQEEESLRREADSEREGEQEPRGLAAARSLGLTRKSRKEGGKKLAGTTPARMCMVADERERSPGKSAVAGVE